MKVHYVICTKAALKKGSWTKHSSFNATLCLTVTLSSVLRGAKRTEFSVLFKIVSSPYNKTERTLLQRYLHSQSPF